MAVNEAEGRLELLKAMKETVETGLNTGTSGNVSVRLLDGNILISPSGVPPKDLTPDMFILMTPEGEVMSTKDTSLKPSSEWHMHLEILRVRKDINSIVHAHPPYCTALAMCRHDIPACHYMIAAIGGSSIRCSGYAPYGTPALSQEALNALEQRNGCLIGNHGMLAAGASVSKALWLAVEMETLARQYCIALQIGGPMILSNEEISKTIERFADYGLDRT